MLDGITLNMSLKAFLASLTHRQIGALEPSEPPSLRFSHFTIMIVSHGVTLLLGVDLSLECVCLCALGRQ